MKYIFILISIGYIFFSCEEEYIPENEIIITASEYTSSSKYPKVVSNYELRFERMQLNNDITAGYVYYDSVSTSEIKITSDDYPNFGYGRFVVSVSKNGKSDVLEVIYKGGSIQLNMILK